jgi:beta-galactosidase/beta-glucuronidase
MEDYSRPEHALTPAKFVRIELKTGWEFKQINAIGVPEPTDEFTPVAQFPTNIHLDLEFHKRIPDPFMGPNEYKVQWVGEQQWLYKTDFDIQTKPGHLEKLVLQFDGLEICVKDESAAVTVTGDIESASEGDPVVFTLINLDGQFIETSDPLSIAHDSASTTFNVHKAQFWWPTGYGKQPLYTIGSKLIRKVSSIRRPVHVP